MLMNSRCSPSIKYPRSGGRTTRNPRLRGGEEPWDAIGSIQAAVMLTWMQMRHRKGERCNQQRPYCPPPMLADPPAWPYCSSAAEPHVALPSSRFCLAAWAIFSCL